jgi:hypothetical protein
MDVGSTTHARPIRKPASLPCRRRYLTHCGVVPRMRAACWAETKPRLGWPALRRLAIAFIVPQFAFLWESRAVPQGTGAEGVRGTRVVGCGLRQGGFALPSHPRGEPSPARPVANAALDYSLSVPVILQAARRATPPRPASSPSGLSTYGLIPVVTALSRRAHRMLPTVASVLRGASCALQ